MFFFRLFTDARVMPCRHLADDYRPGEAVRLRLPEGLQPRGIQFLCSEQWPRVIQAGQALTIVVPRVVDHEVIAIDL